MAFKTLKKTLCSMILAASMALNPAVSKAQDSAYVGLFRANKPDHVQWVFDNKVAARSIVLGFDVLFGCLKSGIGARYNGSGFWNGCGKGVLGGAVMFAGEYVASYNRYPMVGAGGKLVHDLGVSMSDNVMRGEGMFSQYETELGPATLTFRDSFVPHPSFTLTPAVAIGANLLDKQEFDAKLSLYNLTPVFRKVNFSKATTEGDNVAPGSTRGNVITYTDMTRMDAFKQCSWCNDHILSHELNHALFWSKSRFAKDIVNKLPAEKVRPWLEMEKVQRWWNVGQDILGNAYYAPMSVYPDAYHYTVPELEAYIMSEDLPKR